MTMQESWLDLAKVAFMFVVVMVLVIQWHWNSMMREEARELREKIKRLEGGLIRPGKRTT